MTTPTEDLVAELREMGESVLDPLIPTEARAAAAIMRATEWIETQERNFDTLADVNLAACRALREATDKIEAQAERIAELERWVSVTDPWRP